MAEIDMEEHPIFGDHSISRMPIPQPQHIRRHQIRDIRLNKIILGNPILLVPRIMLPQVQLKCLIHQRPHLPTIIGMYTGIIFGILHHLNIPNLIIHRENSVDTHFKVVACLEPDIIHDFEDLEGELVLADIVAGFEDYALEDELLGFVVGAFAWGGGGGDGGGFAQAVGVLDQG